nr:immunoglobulin heavy chain junction region [Mus musculus]
CACGATVVAEGAWFAYW